MRNKNKQTFDSPLASSRGRGSSVVSTVARKLSPRWSPGSADVFPPALQHTPDDMAPNTPGCPVSTALTASNKYKKSVTAKFIPSTLLQNGYFSFSSVTMHDAMTLHS